MRMAATIVFILGIGVSAVFASRVVEPDVEEGEQPTASERVGAWWGGGGVGFSIGAVMMIAGGLLMRRARGASAGPAGSDDTDSVSSLMTSIREALDGLPEDPKTNAKELKEGLDEILEELVPRFLDRREAMVDEMGLGPFAEMIGHFATMERNAARAWSALIDEAYDEIPGCLERAREGMARAQESMGS